jgi:hypothetical protein
MGRWSYGAAAAAMVVGIWYLHGICYLCVFVGRL